MCNKYQRIILSGIMWILMSLIVDPCQGQPDKAVSGWPEITREAKPWSRWWWMGSAVDEPNLSRLIASYDSAGFGGLEITPIYGAVGYEGRYLSFLSPSWMKMLDVSVREAGRHNMGIDMNTGTGWPFGGPQVKPATAASRLIIQTYHLAAGEKLSEKIVPADPKQKKAGAWLQAVTAYGDAGQVRDLTALTGKDGTLDWVAEKGNWEIYAAFCGKTQQLVKRAAPGGEGLTFDHFSGEALQVYLSRFDSAFQSRNHGVRTFFNDSYEVYGTNWSPSVFDEFLKRRGYKLQLYLREMAEKTPATEQARRVQCDYRETISDMLHDNFTTEWTRWSHRMSSSTRNQAHGSPGNLLDLYAAVDIPECETFGSSMFPIPGLRRDSADIRNVDPDPVMLKFASSAANVSGKKLTSCETFTWLAEHFRVSLSQCKPEVEQAFLSGVNHVFYHGTAYSPADAGWPGWLFYASVNFAPSNSFWPHINGLNGYIGRCQSLLQSGVPANDLLVYWPVYDIWMAGTNPDIMLTIHSITKWLYPTPFSREVKALMKQGYSLDFVSDKLLNNVSVKNGQVVTKSGSSYRAIIIPAAGFMPVATLQRLNELATSGAEIIFQQLPGDVPGLNDLASLRKQKDDLLKSYPFVQAVDSVRSAKTGTGEVLLSQNLEAALAMKKIGRETLVDLGLKYIKRKEPGGICYYLVNHTPNAIDQYVPFRESGKECLLLDPQSGMTGIARSRAGSEGRMVRLQLRPGEAMFVRFSDRLFRGGSWKYGNPKGSPVEIKGPWKLAFARGGAVLPESREIGRLVSWTEFSDPAARNFSGSASYETTFELKGAVAGDYLLDIGHVCESAHVWVNGQDAGILWSIPFTARIGQFMKPGQNSIRIEVSNLMANRIRQMDKGKTPWRNYHEINFVNIDYKPFDASGWEPMPSGLLGPVTIQPMEIN